MLDIIVLSTSSDHSIHSIAPLATNQVYSLAITMHRRFPSSHGLFHSRVRSFRTFFLFFLNIIDAK